MKIEMQCFNCKCFDQCIDAIQQKELVIKCIWFGNLKKLFNDTINKINSIGNVYPIFDTEIVKLNVDEDGNIIASTDFTDESKNLEVWKALGLQEEDFYK